MSLSDRLRRAAYRLTGRDSSLEDERLLALFRNRIELKKELNALDEERHQLLDRLKLQEGATMRVEEQLGQLEQYLGRPDEGYKSIAYFQLRAVWRTASRRLQHFSAELARQQKDRERRQQLAKFERIQGQRIGEIDREINEARVLSDELQSEQRLDRKQLEGMRGFWNYFRRRRLVERINNRAARLDAVLTELAELGDRREEIDTEPPPLFEGMSVEGRRAVNLAVLGFAECLYDRLALKGLADLARQSTVKRVYETSYGEREACESLIRGATSAIAELEQMQEDLPEIKSRTDRLRRSVSYKAETDVTPAPESVPPIKSRNGRESANVLLDEYWDIYKSLLR
jgi:DNA repair exonuclease SbcCD ATPase subunit